MGYRSLLAAAALVLAAALPARAQDAGAEWQTHTQAAVRAFGLAQMDIAENEAKISLELAEKNFAATDERLQTSVLNSFAIEKALQHFDRAVALGTRVEAMQRAADPGDPNLAITIGMLAAVYRDMKNTDLMIATYERAIATYNANIGETDPVTVNVREDYAGALAGIGRREEAAKLWAQVVVDWAEALSPNHLRRSLSYAGYAELLRSLGRTAEADAADAESKRIANVWNAGGR